ncbi:MAG: DUF2155 domain-containing protein [Rubellimicrobium sp.]|nr:DUF2155 domain-containing protein [Rubellimicrobium sp.]
MIRPGAAAFALAIATALAQPAGAVATVTVTAGTVRVLDKITGRVEDLALVSGETAVVGHLSVTMGECRYPRDNPTGDAFVQLVIHDSRSADPVFSGWMVASAPALNPLDHPRYDVWAIDCQLPESATPALTLTPAPEEAPAE